MEKRERENALSQLLREAGVSPAWWQATRVIIRVLRVLISAAIALVIVGAIVGVVAGDQWVWIGGLALFLVAVQLILVVGWLWRRRTETFRWQDGTVTFRAVEHGYKDDWPYVTCDAEINLTPHATDESDSNPPTRRAWLSYQKSVAWDSTNIKGVVDGATMRCLVDRMNGSFGGSVLRAFPKAGRDATLPSGPEIKFEKARAKRK
jgi:hypothetical protein